jgi:hypothetical protein
METVLDALKSMGKATAREIAARMKIEPATALDMLRELEESVHVTQSNGYWMVTGGDIKPAPASTKPVVIPPVRVTISDLIALLTEHGPKTAEDLSKLAGVESKRVAPMLTHHMTKGRILREKVGGKFVYSVASAAVPASVTDAQPAITPSDNGGGLKCTVIDSDADPVGRDGCCHDMSVADETARQNLIHAYTRGGEKSTSEIVSDIPAFASRPDDLIIPSSRFISSEIRRAKAKLASWQKLQSAARELRRYKRLLVEAAQ